MEEHIAILNLKKMESTVFYELAIYSLILSGTHLVWNCLLISIVHLGIYYILGQCLMLQLFGQEKKLFTTTIFGKFYLAMICKKSSPFII